MIFVLTDFTNVTNRRTNGHRMTAEATLALHRAAKKMTISLNTVACCNAALSRDTT